MTTGGGRVADRRHPVSGKVRKSVMHQYLPEVFVTGIILGRRKTFAGRQ
ncbi:MAG: hypothetical protein M3466_10550 [Gemmatimonadota bacterium]|nr:hypothetical protein [Gemmatimonadota bacterium]